MNEHDKNEYIRRYNKRLKEHGVTPEALGWGGGKSKQFLRFESALDVEKFFQEDKCIKSVLDVGCGFGDLGVFLKENFPRIKYVGFDINKSLIDHGKKANPFLDLRDFDILNDTTDEKFDVVIENGIFNYELKGENQITYISSMLKKMYELSNYAVCADFMSTFVDFSHPNSFHMNEYDAISIGKEISSKVVLRNDYLPYEYMIYILRESYE